MTKRFLLLIALVPALLAGCMVLPGPPFVGARLIVEHSFVPRDEPDVIVFPSVLYAGIRFEVQGPPVIVNRVIVTYANGEREDMAVNWRFGHGDWQRELRLRAGDRHIRNVAVYWKPERGYEGRKATVRVFGVD